MRRRIVVHPPIAYPFVVLWGCLNIVAVSFAAIGCSGEASAAEERDSDAGGPPALGHASNPPACPHYEPITGAPCVESLSCAYVNRCGRLDRATCPGPGSKWSLEQAACPPSCPASLPAQDADCPTFEGRSCHYDNGCGKFWLAHCQSGKWLAYGGGSCTSADPCPATKPTSDSSCSGWTYRGCTYAVGGDCTAACFCADDARWACFPKQCTPLPE